MLDQQRPELLTVRQTAEWLGVSASTVRRRIRSGALPALKLGESRAAPVRIAADEVQRWLYAPRGGQHDA